MGILSSYDLLDQKAIVTGASRGLGRAIAIALAQAGADVVITFNVNVDMAQQTAAEVEKLGRKSLVIKMDVAKSDEINQVVEKTLKEFGRINILVNNAGINRRVPAEQMSETDWKKVIDVNLTGVFLCSQAVGRQMIKQKSGRIINIASVSGVLLNRGVTQVAYYAAKAGVILLTKALAMEWAKHNIRVNAISPGWMRTSLVESEFIVDKKKYQEIIEDTPMRRFGEPRELGPAVVYLASTASSFITGENLVIDGGYATL
jgi:NAD(P)-dependent dehydrogenase (short-subunit alcohol dehydrogenase family)